MCCFGEQENRDLTQSLLGDQKHVTKVESTAILSGTREVSSGVFSSHTEYQVQLHVTGAVIPSCWKRYSDFEAMHMGMMEQAPHMLAAFSVVLPPKSISNSREAKEMRRQNLEEYLRRVVASASLLYSKDLQDFVGCEPTIVEQMNASATEQQRHIKALWQAQLKEEMGRKCATPNPVRDSHDAGRSTPSAQHAGGGMPRSRSLGLGGGVIPDVVSLLTSQPQARVAEVEVPPHDLAFSQIMQMFDIKGGSKVRGGFSLSRVARIENAELRSKYRDAVASVTATPNFFTLPCPVTNPLSNEALLFCSAAADDIDTVTERGFMKEERQFGLGVYFMDNATKAHIATYKGAADLKEFTLLLARVTLGDPCVLLQADPSLNAPPQPQRGGFFSKREDGPAVHHSCVGESKAYNKNASNLYREYIVYSEHQAYPEYKVTYTKNE